MSKIMVYRFGVMRTGLALQIIRFAMFVAPKSVEYLISTALYDAFYPHLKEYLEK